MTAAYALQCNCIVINAVSFFLFLGAYFRFSLRDSLSIESVFYVRFRAFLLGIFTPSFGSIFPDFLQVGMGVIWRAFWLVFAPP